MTLEEFAREAVGRPVPFLEFGRSLDGWDCWGLVCVGYELVRNVRLRQYANRYDSVRDLRCLRQLFEDRQNIDEWHPVTRARPMDLALIYRRNRPIHVGMLLPDDLILHAEEDVDTVVEPVQAFRIEGWYRPVLPC